MQATHFPFGSRVGIARRLSALFVAIAVCCAVTTRGRQSTSPREQLEQYIADLQKNPSDDALREKVIALGSTLEPPPQVPEEARRHFVKGDTLARDAHTADDFPSTIEEYQQALALAPWWADAYHDLAFVLETAGRFDDAKKNLHFYLLTKPADKEARAAQDEIYRIEAKQQESVKRATSDAKAATASEAERQRQTEQRLEGRYVYHMHREGRSRSGPWWQDWYAVLDIRDGQVIGGTISNGDSDNTFPVGFYQQHFTVSLSGREFHREDADGSADGVISEDGSSITLVDTPAPAYHAPPVTTVYRRQ